MSWVKAKASAVSFPLMILSRVSNISFSSDDVFLAAMALGYTYTKLGVPPGVDFSEALTYLNAGHRVRRRGDGVIGLKSSGVLHKYDAKRNIWYYWMVTQTDIMAHDWELADSVDIGPIISYRGDVPSRYECRRVI